MKRILTLSVLSLLLLSRAYADAMQQVQGSTTGTFSNAAGTDTTSASGDTWTYYDGTGNESSVVVTGNSFGLAPTPLTTLLATLTLNNGGNGSGNDTFTADLNLLVSFTTPAGQSSNLIDGLQLTTDTGGPDNDTLVVTFGGLPSPQSFLFGGYTYTVTLDGYFDAPSGGSLLSNLVVANPGGNNTTTGYAYLIGTITSEPSVSPLTSAVPEPTSVLLLSTVVAVVAFVRRRNQVKTQVR